MKPIIAVPITALLIIRSYRRQSLTIPGLLAATLTAIIHALPESPLPFTLLCTFFLLGTSATKVKHAEKAKLTLSSSGSSGGEGSRTHVQVLANSACASLLCLIEYFTRSPVSPPSHINPLNPTSSPSNCLPLPTTSLFPSYATNATLQPPSTSPYLPLLLLGIIANYAAASADTLSSELGILSRTTPFLITQPWRRVPRGTNGGVTPAGILYGNAGAAAIAAISIMLLPPFCSLAQTSLAGKIVSAGARAADQGLEGGSGVREKAILFAAITVWGTMGSLLDSLLGALLQASVVDRRTGKVVEGAGGVRVLTHRRGSSAASIGSASGADGSGFGAGGVATKKKAAAGGGGVGKQAADGNGVAQSGQESRYVSSGRDVLDNNGINFLMAAVMTLGGVVGAGWLGALLA